MLRMPKFRKVYECDWCGEEVGEDYLKIYKKMYFYHYRGRRKHKEYLQICSSCESELVRLCAEHKK